VLLNGRHFPQQQVRQWWTNLMINLVILGVMSLLPGISFLGHLGGLLVGAASVLLLHVEREAANPWRWGGVVGLVLMPLLFWGTLYPSVTAARSRVQTETTKKEEKKTFETDFLPRVRKAGEQDEEVYLKQFWPLTKKNSKKRDPAKVREVREAIDQRRKETTGLSAELDQVGPYQDESAETARTTGLDYLRELNRLLEMADTYLEKGENDEDALVEQEKKVSTAKEKWEKIAPPSKK
jgi:hypothetical protein